MHSLIKATLTPLFMKSAYTYALYYKFHLHLRPYLNHEIDFALQIRPYTNILSQVHDRFALLSTNPPCFHGRFALFFLHVSHYICLKNPLQVLIFSGFKRFFGVFYITPKLRILFPIRIQYNSKTASSSSKNPICSKIASSSARKSSFLQILFFRSEIASTLTISAIAQKTLHFCAFFY